MNVYVFFIACILLQVNGQFFGGFNQLPYGGRRESVGYNVGPAWGSISQDRDRLGFTGPKTYGTGLNLLTPKGTGLTGTVLHQPGFGGQASVGAQANLFSGQNSDLNAWAKHDRSLDKNFKIVGPETNSAGLNFEHKNGVSAFGSVSKTNGQPSISTIGGGLPLYQSKDGNTKLSVEGSSSFQSGMPRNDNIGVKLESTF